MDSIRRRVRGFTLIELVVVIAVIGILATITAVGLSRYQGDTRDARRSSSIISIDEALEKYYDANGEYPSCSALSAAAATVSQTTLKGIDQATLVAPQAGSSDTNSIKCTSSGNTLTVNGTDFFEYQGDGSPECAGSGSCLSFTLKYKDEIDGVIKTIASRRSTSIATSGLSQITATTTGNSTTSVSWSQVPNATSYTMQSATNSGFTSSLTSTSGTTLSTGVTGLNAGTTYYYRVQAFNGALPGNWSNTATATTTITQPTTAPTIAASLFSATVARGSAGGGTCSGGTIQYQIRYNSTNTATDGAWSSWSVGATRDQSGVYQGNKYTFQSQSLCVGPNASSSTIISASTSSVVVPINALAAPVYLNSTTSWQAGYNYYLSYSASCPTGTNSTYGGVIYRRWNVLSAQNTNYYLTPVVDWWYTAWNSGVPNANYSYYAKYGCSTTYASVDSPEQYNNIYVYCSGPRQSWSASPRCDNTGQGQAGNGGVNY